MSMPSPAAKFGAVFAALFAAHQVADHWVQTEHQAATKGMPGAEGWKANLGHVASYTATQGAALAVADRALGLRLTPGRALAALALSAITHSVIDRRWPLKLAAERTGHAGFYALGAPRPTHPQSAARPDNPCLGTGAYAMDQSAHIGFIAVAALLAATGRRS